MTVPKHNNTLYRYVKSVINQAIPLEYAIRSARLHSGIDFKVLFDINSSIQKKWRLLGAKKSEIDDFRLLETSWDFIQAGISLRRSDGRHFLKWERRLELLKNLPTFQTEFKPQTEALDIPAIRFFRIFDLLNGNNIRYLIDVVARSLNYSKEYEITDDIEIDEFPGKIREPIHIHPAVQYGPARVRRGQSGLNKFCLNIDLRAEISAPDLNRQIREFLYRYAVFREYIHGYEPLSRDLISEFKQSEMKGEADKHGIVRIDGYLSVLSGLYCWDLHEKFKENGEKSPLDKAIDDTLSIYPKTSRQVTADTIRRNYNLVRKEIRSTSFRG